eukprot:225179-Alexandrium_andersonii.AAC.1
MVQTALGPGVARVPARKGSPAPSEQPPSGRRSVGEDASTQQLGMPRSGTPNRSVESLLPKARR